MAYDLMAGDRSIRRKDRGRDAKSSQRGTQVMDLPQCVAQLRFEDLPALSRLQQYCDSNFLHRISCLFEDQAFSLQEVETAQAQLLPLMLQDLPADARSILHTLLAALSFARWRGTGLYGVAD